MARSCPVDSPEFAFLRQCCAANFPAAPVSPARPSPDLDWDRFVALTRRHRVQGLCWKTIGSLGLELPAEAGRALGEDSKAIAEKGLRTALASTQLLDAFRLQGLALLFLKGQTVASLAYGDPWIKLSWDLDILVRPDELEPACQVLDRLGYVPTLPADRSAVGSWHRRSKESVWSRPDAPPLELHTRIADHPDLLPALDARSPAQDIAIHPGSVLPTFARPQLFAYLAVHGASSAWFRLKWLADFAGILANSDADEIDALYRQSQPLGAGRAAGWALLLACRLFETPLSPGLRRRLEDDPALRRLVRIGLRQLEAVEEPTRRLLGTAGIHASQLLLVPGPRFALSEALRQFRGVLR